jgi:hypothetical protein
MTFINVITKILSSAVKQFTPQEIREIIKREHPEFHGTQAHIRNVEKGHYRDVDHALLAQIYTAVRTHKHFFCDKNSKPMKVSLQIREARQRAGGTQPTHRKQSWQSPSVNLRQYEEKVRDILENSEKYHEAYYKAETFRGPSLYFHQRALETRQSLGSLTHLEYVYATLAS